LTFFPSWHPPSFSPFLWMRRSSTTATSSSSVPNIFFSQYSHQKKERVFEEKVGKGYSFLLLFCSLRVFHDTRNCSCLF
jgi:hypothetical protein